MKGDEREEANLEMHGRQGDIVPMWFSSHGDKLELTSRTCSAALITARFRMHDTRIACDRKTFHKC